MGAFDWKEVFAVLGFSRDEAGRLADFFLNCKAMAAVARMRRGELLGGVEGAALVQNSEICMRSQSIRNPRAFAFMLAPWKASGS